MPTTNMDDAKSAEKIVSEALVRIYARFACAVTETTRIKFVLVLGRTLRRRRQRMVLQSTGLAVQTDKGVSKYCQVY